MNYELALAEANATMLALTQKLRAIHDAATEDQPLLADALFPIISSLTNFDSRLETLAAYERETIQQRYNMASMSPAERVEFVSTLLAGYCGKCGYEVPLGKRCHCDNDE